MHTLYCFHIQSQVPLYLEKDVTPRDLAELIQLADVARDIGSH